MKGKTMKTRMNTSKFLFVMLLMAGFLSLNEKGFAYCAPSDPMCNSSSSAQSDVSSEQQKQQIISQLPPEATGSGKYAYQNSSSSSVQNNAITQPSLMAVKTQKIMGLVSAVTAEAAEAMGSGGSASSSADSGLKIAGSS